ncbi:hypothetical protein CgunFtcFv8_005316 [Champsocephalus gunnari]|uniref:UPAR/Ly6 domain-containing protein n=1 Tax=Champsocephalus gunnari TaxID=52237 RepID=A0AAN8CY47_CHAGU|nr:hypothetical protein CgunFtcFv8_005316 [Champsocephalus gunnari]
MNRIILLLLAVGFCFAVGQSLQCYKCTIGFGDFCITSKITCASGELCYSGNGEAVGFVDVKKKGCLVLAKCNTTENTDLPYSISSSNTTLYHMTKTCCDTNLCNAAPGLPGASGVSLALATATALFMANILV